MLLVALPVAEVLDAGRPTGRSCEEICMSLLVLFSLSDWVSGTVSRASLFWWLASRSWMGGVLLWSLSLSWGAAVLVGSTVAFVTNPRPRDLREIFVGTEIIG